MSDGEPKDETDPRGDGAARRERPPLPDLDYEIVFPDDADRRADSARRAAEEISPADVIPEVTPETAPSAFRRRPDVRPPPIVVQKPPAPGKSAGAVERDGRGGPRVVGGGPREVPEPPVEVEPEPSLDGPPPETFERPGGPLSRYDPHLVMYHDPRGLQAEQYRTCRTNITALNRTGAPWAVVVTSSKAGEGKSVTAANLAVCLAELPGSRVCLLDTDFRAPTQGTIFGLPSGVGLSELLTGAASWKDAVRPSRIRDLDIMLSGAEPASPAELLGGDRFVNLMQELKRRYTWIVLDTPPVNPFTDACVVSTVSNGALLVIRLQETSRELVNRTIDSITTAGGRVLGSFLTGVTPDRDEAERQEYYRVEGEAGGEGERERSRERVERKLRRQERAWLKKRKKRERAGEESV